MSGGYGINWLAFLEEIDVVLAGGKSLRVTKA